MSARNRVSSIVYSEWPEYGIILDESHHGPRFSMPVISRDYLKFFFIIKGETELVFPERKTVLRMRENEFAFVPKNLPHFLRDFPKKGPVSLYVLSFKDTSYPPSSEEMKTVQGMNNDFRCLARKSSTLEYEFGHIRTLLEIIKSEQFTSQTGRATVVRGLATGILFAGLRMLEQRKPAPLSSGKTLAEIKRIIDKRYFEQLQVSRLAALSGMSLNGFILRFRRAYGLTPLQYLHKQRVRFARRRLRTSSKSIQDVCYDSGFNDISFFYKTFKKFTGKTPYSILGSLGRARLS